MADASGYPQTPTSPGKAESTVRRVSSDDSLQKTPPPSELGQPVERQSIPILQHPEVTLRDAPASPISINPPASGIVEPETASARLSSAFHTPPTISLDHLDQTRDSIVSLSLNDDLPPPPPPPPKHETTNDRASLSGFQLDLDVSPTHDEHEEVHSAAADQAGLDYHLKGDSVASEQPGLEDHVEGDSAAADQPGLQYHGFDDLKKKKKTPHRTSHMTMHSVASSASSGSERRASHGLLMPNARSSAAALQRPASTYTLGQDLRGRTLSPYSINGSDDGGSPGMYARDLSTSRKSPGQRPMSYVDLLNNVPYNQQIAPSGVLSNAGLQSVVGNAASLLDTKKTLDMYRANLKKTQDAAVQYEFAIFMVNTARDATPGDGINGAELITEAKHVLQRLSDRAYPFAQYYLADGFFSGLFNKNKPDHDKAFPLFVSASKHGHAESGYRAALCYEFGWGTAKSYPKAVQFYRAAASKNHPGAATRLGLACIKGDMGLGRTGQIQREGIRWLKRAQESADFQYNNAPYELGLMHLSGFGGEIFKDEAYAAQLLTQAAELGHPQANYLMGQAYENGLYGCPRDAALSVHFYNGAATRAVPEAMMALCAWYMVGAEPVLEKDEGEAYAWASQAAESGLAKAQYAVGYFTEMGIGCRRDPLEANVWYVRAADQGNDMATQRLQIIRAAASGETGVPMEKAQPRSKDLAAKDHAGKKKVLGIF